MACTVSIVEKPQHLVVTVSGDNTLETLHQYMQEIPAACVRLRKMRVLVIVKLTGPDLPMLEVYKAVSAGSDNAADLGMRVAYVDQNPDHSVDTMLVAENVAQGRGIPVQSYLESDEAESWLLADDN